MAIILYSNGITENFKSEDLVFTEDELVYLFDEFEEIKTCRVPFLINTWCIYGFNPINDEADFNGIASYIIEDPVYSHILFVHDSELDPDWNVTDTVLYKGYNEFLVMIKKAIDDAANIVLNEIAISHDYENKIDHLPQLSPLGATNDKRVLFSYNPDDQTSEFYKNEEFYKFSQKVYEYIMKNKQHKEPFTIYADKKAVIIIESFKVKKFLNTMLEKFQSKEEYEVCTQLTKVIKDWTNIIEPKKTKIRKSRLPKKDNKTE